MWKYELGTVADLADNTPTKGKWKTRVLKAVHSYWSDQIDSLTPLYSTLFFLRQDKYVPGKIHPLLSLEYTARESERLKTKVRLLTGTYMLQTKRKNFNQYDINPTCQMCGEENETAEHFVLKCSALHSVRQSIMVDIERQWGAITETSFNTLPVDEQLYILINSWPTLKTFLKTHLSTELHEFEKHCGRLLYSLDRTPKYFFGKTSCVGYRRNRMAEAHSAVAFSFTVTHEGVDVNVNHDAIWAVWNSGVHSWKKRLGKAKNKVKAGTYPGSPSSWLFVAVIILAIRLADHDPSFGIIGFLQKYIPGMGSEGVGLYISCLLFSTLLWLAIILSLKYTLKVLLMYHGWMYEGRGPVSFPTRAWGLLIRMFGGRKPMLNSYQASLPKLFVPAVSDTISRYLLSVRPIYDDEKIARLTKLAHEFQSGLGKKLQRYLILKSWWATNYVSDWWEEYVYLRGRSPIMVNSNYYGVDAVLMHPTTNAAARAANVTYAMLQYRRELDREELNPILLNKTVPLCSAQYERQFNTTRIPGIETDRLVHLPDSKHVAVYHKGRFFKVYIHFKGQHLKPCELEKSFQKILDDTNPPVDGEELIPALTGGDRVPWAQARMEYFSKGKNKASLDAIEKAAFFITFDDKEQNFVKGDQNTFDTYAQTMLHGNGSNRWFDKSFNLVVCPNGRIGFNAEHSWADAPIMAHLWEFAVTDDHNLFGYTEDGHTKGEAVNTPNPVRLEWDLAPECKKVIASSYQTCLRLISDVDLHFLMHDAFGKGLMKECKTSPDAFIQMALQLAYYR
ncbi:hypothetical protein DPMN_049597, partial [Dreissena polymorpha]